VSRLCGQYLHSLGIPEPLHSLRHYFGSLEGLWSRCAGGLQPRGRSCANVGLAAYAAVRWSRGASAAADDQALP